MSAEFHPEESTALPDDLVVKDLYCIFTKQALGWANYADFFNLRLRHQLTAVAAAVIILPFMFSSPRDDRGNYR